VTTHPIPESDEDKAALRRVLQRAADAWSRLDDLAAVLGVSRPAVSQYLSGARGVGWHVVCSALLRTARRYPAEVPGLVAVLALELLDARGRWVPEGEREGRSVVEEAGDLTVALGRLLEAATRGGTPEEIAELGRAVVREAEEVAAAARRGAA
jgi:transcriptional regulator with XRE-family HTH domain